jgi:hypothetical protein
MKSGTEKKELMGDDSYADACAKAGENYKNRKNYRIAGELYEIAHKIYHNLFKETGQNKFEKKAKEAWTIFITMKLESITITYSKADNVKTKIEAMNKDFR